MKSLRQLGGGIFIALVSVILVIGGIFLSLAETRPSPATPTQLPPTLRLSFPTSIASLIPVPSETPTATHTQTTTSTPLSGNTPLPPTICAPPSGWIQITVTAGDTIYSIAQRYQTTAESLSAANCLASLDLPPGYALLVPPVQTTATLIPCGAPAGWVKTYIVQPGDNLFRISLSYRTTVPQLQRANCMGSETRIFSGQRLWVPNVPTSTPGITLVPTFPTSTNTSQPTATATSQAPTPTAELPTATASLIAPTAPTATIPVATELSPTSSTPASP